MFDFARIGVMQRYADLGKWPLSIPRVLKNKYRVAGPAPISRLERIARRLTHRVAPAAIAPALPFYYSGHVFRCGTRAWEYPWTLDVLERQKPGLTVLDVGCGSSEFLFQYVERGFHVMGLDHVRSAAHPQSELRREFVDEWSDTIRFVDGGAEAMPLDSGSVDVVVCLSVMEHAVRRDDPGYHHKILAEMKRVLRKGGILISTYDTFMNPSVVFAGVDGWGNGGWHHLDDIAYLDMELLDPRMPALDREVVNRHEDTFFIPPDIYFAMKYGTGFEEYGSYHRLTSVGFVLVK